MAWEESGSTALVVPVPEAELLVGHHRRRHTPSGADGMPAHVTLVAPFVRAPLLSADDLRQLQRVLDRFATFRFRLTRADRFRDGTLYLAPEPPQPFVEMSIALTTSFLRDRAAPPTDVVPHLTVARSDDPWLLEPIERELAAHLPVEAEAREVLLMERDAGRHWGTRIALALADADRRARSSR